MLRNADVCDGMRHRAETLLPGAKALGKSAVLKPSRCHWAMRSRASTSMSVSRIASGDLASQPPTRRPASSHRLVCFAARRRATERGSPRLQMHLRHTSTCCASSRGVTGKASLCSGHTSMPCLSHMARIRPKSVSNNLSHKFGRTQRTSRLGGLRMQPPPASEMPRQAC